MTEADSKIDQLPRITFETAGDEVLHRGSCVPHLDGIPIAPGAIVEQRCRLDAELEGLVRPSHTVWCVCGLATVKAIGFGVFRDSNGMRGPVLRAVVSQFQWAPPMHISSDLWIDRHVQPNEICQLGTGFTNWRARVVEPLVTERLSDQDVEWLAESVANTPNVSVFSDPGHPGGMFYRRWEQELFGNGLNEDYLELTGYCQPEFPYRCKFVVGEALIAPIVDTVRTPFQGLQAFSVLPSGASREALDQHLGPVSGDRYHRGAVEIGDWVAYPVDRYGEMELSDCNLAIVWGERFYLFNKAAGVTLGPMSSYWALRRSQDDP